MCSELIIRLLNVFAINESYKEVADLSAERLPLSGVGGADHLIKEHNHVLHVCVHKAKVEQHVPCDNCCRELPIVLCGLHRISHSVKTVEEDGV